MGKLFPVRLFPYVHLTVRRQTGDMTVLTTKMKEKTEREAAQIFEESILKLYTGVLSYALVACELTICYPGSLLYSTNGSWILSRNRRHGYQVECHTDERLPSCPWLASYLGKPCSLLDPFHVLLNR